MYRIDKKKKIENVTPNPNQTVSKTTLETKW